MDEKMLIASEACFEQDPSPQNAAWFERVFCATFVQHEPEKDPCATHVQHTKSDKT